MTEYKITDIELTATADAIRNKTGTTATILYDQDKGFADAIANIDTGVDTSDATATANDILSGKTGYVNNVKITGNIPIKTSSDVTMLGNTITVPTGYYSSATTYTIATATHPNPTISINTSNGLITASHTQDTGYVVGGTTTGTMQLTTQGAQTITPGTSNKTAVATNRYTTGATIVAGSANLIADNIKSGINIFGVTGTNNGILTGNIFTFNNSYTDISTSHFSGITTLTVCNFPYITKISNQYAFRNCTNLTNFYPNKTTVTQLSYSAAFSGDSKCYFYVPAGLLNSYKTATNWTYYSTKFVGY